MPRSLVIVIFLELINLDPSVSKILQGTLNSYANCFLSAEQERIKFGSSSIFEGSEFRKQKQVIDLPILTLHTMTQISFNR